MNYTKNHHLPQWVKSDRIRMEDFNNAMSSIESGLDGAVSKADSAQTSASSALSKATAAQSDAAAALQKAAAAFTAENMPFVVGSYTGDGDNQHILLGFKPSFLIISGMQDTQEESVYDSFVRYFAMTSDNANIRRRVQILPAGFMLYPMNNYDYKYPYLNEPGRHYDYIAFK